MEEQKAEETNKDITFILISGKPDVGKTRVSNRLHSMIGMNGSFKIHARKGTIGPDHLTHYEKFGKHIVLNSASDDDRCMIDLAKYLDEIAKDGVKPNIIITTIREEDGDQDQMSRMLALLQAIVEGTTNLANYYNQNIASKQVHTDFAPTSISHHTFVLHLEKLNLDNEPDKEKVLIPYIDDNADKLKYALDFALARL